MCESFLRHAGMRASRQASVQDAGRGADRGVRVHRGLLQPAPPSFLDLGDSFPIHYERHHVAISDAHQPDAVLAAVKDKPSGQSPSGAVPLPPAARDGRTLVRAGTEEWLRRGPEEKNGTKQESKMPSAQISSSQARNPPRNRGKSTIAARDCGANCASIITKAPYPPSSRNGRHLRERKRADPSLP